MFCRPCSDNITLNPKASQFTRKARPTAVMVATGVAAQHGWPGQGRAKCHSLGFVP